MIYVICKLPPAHIQKTKRPRNIDDDDASEFRSTITSPPPYTAKREMEETDEVKLLMLKITKILDEARSSYAIHNRKLKELSILRSKSSSLPQFFSAFSEALIPLFDFQKRLASAERVVRFVSVFAASRDPASASDCDEFLDHFLRFLLAAAAAANKTARFRACQIVSEVRIYM